MTLNHEGQYKSNNLVVICNQLHPLRVFWRTTTLERHNTANLQIKKVTNQYKQVFTDIRVYNVYKPPILKRKPSGLRAHVGDRVKMEHKHSDVYKFKVQPGLHIQA